MSVDYSRVGRFYGLSPVLSVEVELIIFLWKFLKFLRQNTFSMISICVFKFLFYFRFHNCSLWIKYCIWLHGYAGKYIFLNTLHDYSDKIIKNAFFCFLFFWIKIALFKNFVKKIAFFWNFWKARFISTMLFFRLLWRILLNCSCVWF